MAKIYDLRREIKKAQELKGISQIADIKLNLQKSDEEIIKDCLKKIETKIIQPILFNTETTPEDKIKEIINLVSCEDNIKVDFEVLDSGYDKELVETVVYYKNCTKGIRVPKEDVIQGTAIKTILSDKLGNTKDFLTMLSIKFKKSLNSTWHLRSNFGKSRLILDLSTELALVYLANEIVKYANANKEIIHYLTMKQILSQDVVYIPSKEDLVLINTYLEKYNLPLLNEKSISEGANRYVKWLADENMFSIDKIHALSPSNNIVLTKRGYGIEEKFVILLKAMAETNEDIKRECNRTNDIATSYSKSYETKKHIPLHIQEKMKNNKFLNWFGEAEFDELCDMDKMNQIESEFVDFAEYMNLPLAKDHSIRFRRLGHHKAAGLYYPSMKAVCIDIKCPSSLAHELLHMIDYTTLKYDNLSNLYNFRSIIDRYKEVTDGIANGLSDESIIKKEWFGKNKFNRDYYHCNAEIFARCGEMYIQYVLNIDNSLVDIRKYNSMYYPKDAQLLEMIEKYFKTIFGEVGIREKKALDIASSSSPKPTKEIQKIKAKEYTSDEKGQLLLF